jgi:pyruvate dehydrogenase E2 component (dihydrolipoamide acetyltransferase)
MPKLGLTMTEATLSRWRKVEGARVKQGEILFEFESDKSLLEFECPTDGTLAKILVPEGETVPCGTPVAVIETALAQRETLTQKQPDTESRLQVKQASGSHKSTSQPSPTLHSPLSTLKILATPAAKRRARELGVDLAVIDGRGPESRIHLADVEAVVSSGVLDQAAGPSREAVTPVARKLASDLELDWTHISGSGPGGRVVKKDVLQATSPQPEPASPPPSVVAAVPTKIEPLTGVRGIIAQRMSESALSAPHVTLFAEADASALVEARRQLNVELADTAKISYNALLVAIVARALRDHPHLNACVVGEEIHYYEDVNIALAVDTERGLLAPVIRQVDRRNLVDIQQQGDALIQAALAGKSAPDDLSGGTFTITNLGMFEIDGFTPIINQPQAAILGVGRIAAKPVVIDDEVKVRQMMTLSLSFDHRLVDGGPAARFLQRIKQLIERPFALVIPPGKV